MKFRFREWREVTPSAALLAARLTPRQRVALLWLPEDGSEREIWARFGATYINNRDICLTRGYVDMRPGPAEDLLIGSLTPLGRRVRDVVARG